MGRQVQKVKYQTVARRLAAHYGYEFVEVSRDNYGEKGYTLTAKDGDTLHEIDFDIFRDRVIVTRDAHFMLVREDISCNETPEILEIDLYPALKKGVDNDEAEDQ